MPVFAVTTAKGPNWDHDRGNREQPYWEEHAAFADELVERGVIILGGPIASDDDEDVALLAVEAPGEEAVRLIFLDDPWSVHGVFRIKRVQTWTIWLDGRSLVPTPRGRPLQERLVDELAELRADRVRA
jgi:uncharacterized protein